MQKPAKVTLSAEVEEYLRISLTDSKQDQTPGTASNAKRNLEWFLQLLEVLGSPPLFTVIRVNTLLTTLEDARQQVQPILQEQYLSKNRTCPIVERHAVLADVLVIPGAGPTTDIPVMEREIMVDIHCGAAVLRGADVFAPGVLGAHQGIQKGDDVSVFADLDGQCRRGLSKPFEGRKLFLGNGKAALGRKDIFVSDQNTSGVAVQMTQVLIDCPCISGVLPSLVFLQNLPSVVVSHVLNPQADELVLDMCAAPGGKTTHIASLMLDKGTVIALDKSEPKLTKIRNNCDRLGVKSVCGYVFDGTKALATDTCTSSETGIFPGQPPYPPQTFDRVLLDAPCSALGQRPQLAVKMSLKSLRSYPRLQRKLFQVAVRLLKVHGTLVYSTCTITAQENEEQVAWALDAFPCLKLAPQTPHLGGPGLENCGLTEEQRSLVQRFHPTQDRDQASCDVDTIGFFIAKFVKIHCAQAQVT